MRPVTAARKTCNCCSLHLYKSMNSALLFALSHYRAILPFAVLAATSAIFLAMRIWLPSAGRTVLSRVENKKVWVPLCLIVVVGYLLIVFCNVAYPGYLEHVEPSIASVSYIILHGAPLYHSMESAQRYAFPYGPMGFLPYALALRVLGAQVMSLKLVVLLANLLLLG